VNIGKVVEKIAPSLPGFPALPQECRSLLEPIDYIVFRGLDAGRIEAIEFVEVKSGKATLNPNQKLVKEAVEDGRVELFIAERAQVEAA
jgi:predicted Holliday junction resolvase-like endonuclease